MNESVKALMWDNKSSYKFVEEFINLYDNEQLDTIIRLMKRKIRQRNIASINNEFRNVV
jgi:hypothetical protein